MKSIWVIIDRIEPPWAILESTDKKTFNFPLNLLPKGSKEGDVLNFNIDIDQEATEQRYKNVQRLINDLNKNDQGGDIQL